jgi:hypothetical protein
VTPEEQRLRDAFAGVSPPVTFGPVQVTEAARQAAGSLGSRPRQQAAGLTAVSDDETTSVSWTVVTPALEDEEVRAIAGTIQGGKGTEQGAPVLTGASQGPAVRSVAYRFDRGTFLVIWAWSEDGGVATVDVRTRRHHVGRPGRRARGGRAVAPGASCERADAPAGRAAGQPRGGPLVAEHRAGAG